MRIWMICALLVCASFVSQSPAAEDRPTPATIHFIDGSSQANVFLIKYGIDQVEWSRDHRSSVVASRSTSEVDRVEIGKISSFERTYLSGVGAFNGRNWESAVNSLAAAGATSRFTYLRVDALYKRAQALLKLKRYDDAIADIQTIKSTYSDWIFAIDAMALEGEVYAAVGDIPKARKAYERLRQMGKELKGSSAARAIVEGSLGEADLLLAADNAKAAIPFLQQSLKAVPLAASPEQHGNIALTLGEALFAANGGDKAKELYMGLRYAPVGGVTRSKTFLALADMELAAGNKFVAFDYYVIAAVMRGGDDAARSKAKGKARRLMKEFAADERLDPEIRKEYRTYTDNL